MNTFGWMAKDNLGKIWRDIDFPEYPGSPTSWSQFVDGLGVMDKYLIYFALRHNKAFFALPPEADQYAYHYNIELEMAPGGCVSRKSVVGTAIIGEFATLRTIDEDGKNNVMPYYTGSVRLMKPSPLAKTA